MLYVVCIIGIGIILLLMMTYSKLNKVDCENENVGEDIMIQAYVMNTEN